MLSKKKTTTKENCIVQYNKNQAEASKLIHAAFDRSWYEHNKGTGYIFNDQPVPDCNTHTTIDGTESLFCCKNKKKWDFLKHLKFLL